MKALSEGKFLRILITGSLIALSVAVANGAVSLNSGTCVKTEMLKSNGGTVYFENNSSKLTKSAKTALNVIAAAQKGSGVVKIEITGFVSAVGPSAKHKSLATARAKSVKSYLESKGLAVEFVTKGVGVTQTKSKSATARKATIQIINVKQVESGGKVPVIKLEQSASFTTSVGVPVSIKAVTIDPATKGDTANPTTLSISPDLPKGLSMDNKTGEITGTPTEEHRLVKYTITAKNNCGSNSVSFEMAIGPANQYFIGVPGFTNPCTNNPSAPGCDPCADNPSAEGCHDDPVPCNAHSPSGRSSDPYGPRQHGCDGIGSNHGMKEAPVPLGGNGNNSAPATGSSPTSTEATPTAPAPTPTYNGKSEVISKK